MNENAITESDEKDPVELTRDLIEVLLKQDDIGVSFNALKMIIEAHDRRYALAGMISGYYEGLIRDPLDCRL